uniref:Uncharacterized protein n=1 Tax=Timema poppense TaxID=170557 RepID=A0A7R9D8G7_TIMPO|nr:unnamed protein product [Timema poppensis]
MLGAEGGGRGQGTLEFKLTDKINGQDRTPNNYLNHHVGSRKMMRDKEVNNLKRELVTAKDVLEQYQKRNSVRVIGIFESLMALRWEQCPTLRGHWFLRGERFLLQRRDVIEYQNHAQYSMATGSFVERSSFFNDIIKKRNNTGGDRKDWSLRGEVKGRFEDTPPDSGARGSWERAQLSFIVILSVRGTLVRKFMLAAYNLGMTRGDWTFLDVELFHLSENSPAIKEQFSTGNIVGRKTKRSSSDLAIDLEHKQHSSVT